MKYLCQYLPCIGVLWSGIHTNSLDIAPHIPEELNYEFKKKKIPFACRFCRWLFLISEISTITIFLFFFFFFLRKDLNGTPLDDL